MLPEYSNEANEPLIFDHIAGEVKRGRVRFYPVDTVEGLMAEVERLRSAIEEYSLWEPGRAGHAAAYRKLMEALR